MRDSIRRLLALWAKGKSPALEKQGFGSGWWDWNPHDREDRPLGRRLRLPLPPHPVTNRPRLTAGAFVLSGRLTVHVNNRKCSNLNQTLSLVVRRLTLGKTCRKTRVSIERFGSCRKRFYRSGAVGFYALLDDRKLHSGALPYLN
jgi:hypothetical protein